MIAKLDDIILAALAKALPADTAVDTDALRKQLADAISPTWEPPAASDNGARRHPYCVLVRQAVRCAGINARARKARWSHVVDALAVGSTFAQELCRQFGVDPDEVIGSYGR